MGKQM